MRWIERTVFIAVISIIAVAVMAQVRMPGSLFPKGGGIKIEGLPEAQGQPSTVENEVRAHERQWRF